jgi:hypothetical protein
MNHRSIALVLLCLLTAGDSLTYAQPQPGPTKPPASIPNPKLPGPPTSPPPSQPKPPINPLPLPSDQSGTGTLVDLRPKFKVGTNVRLRLSNDSTSTIQLPDSLNLPGVDPSRPGKPTTIPTPASKADGSVSLTQQEFTLVFKPTAVSEAGDATVEVVFETIRMKIESEFLTDEFDSTKPNTPSKPNNDPLRSLGEAPLLETSLRPLVGDKLVLTVDPNGNITKVEGGEKFAALFGGTAGGGAAPAPKSGGVQGLFGSLFTLSKTRPHARVGDTWTTKDTLDLSMAGSLTMATTYTLKVAKAGLATLALKGALEPSSAAPSPGPFSIKSCVHEGTAQWNTLDGFLQSMQSVQRLETDINIGGGEPGKATSTQTTTVSRVP